jgi:hypothetical protein
MTGFKISLLETNAHGQDLSFWQLRSLGPAVPPMRQMTLVKTVSCGNFTLLLDVRDWACHSLEDEAAGQGCYN